MFKIFLSRLEKNGIIVADDYNSTTYPGVKTAWDEFLDKKKTSHFLMKVHLDLRL